MSKKLDTKYLINISRVLSCLLNNKIAAGINNVQLSYIRNYYYQSLAVYSYGEKIYVFDYNFSQEIFESLLNWKINSKIRMKRKIKFNIFKSSFLRINIVGKYVLSVGDVGISVSCAKWVKKNKLSLICMIHDLLPCQFKEFFEHKTIKSFPLITKLALENAKCIITNSDDTKNNLIKFATINNIALPKLNTLLLGSKTFPKFNDLCYHNMITKDPYFVMIGTIEPRKNHFLLLQIWKKIIGNYDNNLPKLFIIGQRGWKCGHVVHMLEDCEELKDTVYELNHCSDTEMYMYLKGACALLFPSFAEGYGLPLVEALSLKVPAIVSDLPIFHEIAGEIPEYIDPIDAIKWMSVIMDYASPNSITRQKQMERILNYQAPTWQDHFAALDEIITNI